MREDFVTVEKDMGTIEINDDFFMLRRTAEKENCLFISTIDDQGMTVINPNQLVFAREEIKQLRSLKVNQTLLDKLQQIADEVGFELFIYIKFMRK